MRILFALPGLHRFNRGAEVVFESIAQEIARTGKHHVTLVGSGEPRAGCLYDFIHVPAASREHFERWPKVPMLRTEFTYEDLTFSLGLAALPEVGRSDVTMTCSYPYTNWALRRPRLGHSRPSHVFVTQNGDWPAFFQTGEARLFSCDGLICTNPVYYNRNREHWPSSLIPNGIDPERFHPGAQRRSQFGLPGDRPVVLMVSALEPSKRVLEAMRAVADVSDAFLLVAGDGPLRGEVDQLANRILPGRFRRATFERDQMPDLYRAADVFLHTKILESFGNVYIEALSCGIPIVAHDDEVTRWILGEHAILVDTEMPGNVTSGIQRALAGSSQIEGAAAWACERYAWPVIARNYIDFFQEVLDRRGPSRAPQPEPRIRQGAHL